MLLFTWIQVQNLMVIQVSTNSKYSVLEKCFALFLLIMKLACTTTSQFFFVLLVGQSNDFE
jgi:hypothetical protein